MRAVVDMHGKTFGAWRVLAYDEGHFWFCKCQCGTIKSVNGKTLRNGTSTGCSKCAYERTKAPKRRMAA